MVYCVCRIFRDRVWRQQVTAPAELWYLFQEQMFRPRDEKQLTDTNTGNWNTENKATHSLRKWSSRQFPLVKEILRQTKILARH